MHLFLFSLPVSCRNLVMHKCPGVCSGKWESCIMIINIYLQIFTSIPDPNVIPFLLFDILCVTDFSD